MAVLVLAGIWFGSTHPLTEPVRLADGTQVRIRSVAVGRELYSPYDSPFARMVAKLPGSLRSAAGRVLPPARPAWIGPPAALGLWLESDGPPSTIQTNAPRESAFLVFLNDGRPFRITASTRTTAQLPDGRYVEGHFFPVPPATIPEVFVSLYYRPSPGGEDPVRELPLATWSIRPRPLPTPTNWVGRPLPQQQISEDLEVVLTKLLINADWLRARNPAMSPTNFLRASPIARFELLHLGRPATNWQVERVSYLNDLSGGNFGNSGAWSNGSNFVQWRSPPWPGQVWKLGVEFTRISGFSNSEQVTFTNLMPGTLRTNPLATVHGTVSTKRIVDSQWDSPGVELEMEFGATRLPARLTLLSVTDAHGTSVQGSRSTWSDTETTFHLEKTSLSNAPFTATFALQIGRVLEFVAEPEVGVPPPPASPPSTGP